MLLLYMCVRMCMCTWMGRNELQCCPTVGAVENLFLRGPDDVWARQCWLIQRLAWFDVMPNHGCARATWLYMS